MICKYFQVSTDTVEYNEKTGNESSRQNFAYFQTNCCYVNTSSIRVLRSCDCIANTKISLVMDARRYY